MIYLAEYQMWFKFSCQKYTHKNIIWIQAFKLNQLILVLLHCVSTHAANILQIIYSHNEDT